MPRPGKPEVAVHKHRYVISTSDVRVSPELPFLTQTRVESRRTSVGPPIYGIAGVVTVDILIVGAAVDNTVSSIWRPGASIVAAFVHDEFRRHWAQSHLEVAVVRPQRVYPYPPALIVRVSAGACPALHKIAVVIARVC